MSDLAELIGALGPDILEANRELNQWPTFNKLYGLYPDEGPLQRELYGKHLKHFAAGLRHNDTGAVIAQLDLTIAIDSSMIHLAGALQFPVWMMSRHDQCWRWEWSGRTDSDWYPTLQIFQQRSAGDWADVVRRVCDKLEAKLADPRN